MVYLFSKRIVGAQYRIYASEFNLSRDELKDETIRKRFGDRQMERIVDFFPNNFRIGFSKPPPPKKKELAISSVRNAIIL